MSVQVGGEDLVLLGDVHLDRDDPDLGAFLRFLEAIAPTTRRLVLVGDLFNLWIGRRELEQPHQRAVIEALEALRRRGLVVRYVEGNRDYRIGPAYSGTGLDDATDLGIVERWGGVSLYVAHGDLANERDRRYRAWRRVSRSGPVWMAFNALPRARRLRLAEGLEARLRATNAAYKREFPEASVRGYAARRLQEGHDAVVLGHFHVERDLAARPPSPPGRILILPAWKGSRRHLRVSAEGEVSFVDSPG